MTSEELSAADDRSDWRRVARLTDREIEAAVEEDRDAAPILDETFWDNAQLVDPGHPKTTITMRLDDDVLTYFKAGGPGYQSRMNAVLRAYVYARRNRVG